MTLIELQPLTEQLLDAAVELDRLCLGELWTLDGYRRELESPNSCLLVWVHPQHPLISSYPQPSLLSVKIPDTPPQEKLPRIIGLGCVWAIVDEAHITVLAIHPDYRGFRLGKGLLWGLLDWGWQQQLKWATLEVRASNHIALSLYQRFNFQAAGRRRRYYQDNGEDALILWRGGLQHPEFEQELNQWKKQVLSD